VSRRQGEAREAPQELVAVIEILCHCRLPIDEELVELVSSARRPASVAVYLQIEEEERAAARMRQDV
jgi:hypothetical protein